MPSFDIKVVGTMDERKDRERRSMDIRGKRMLIIRDSR